MLTHDLIRRYQFFKAHAGYVVGRSAECALSLARAEKWFDSQDVYEYAIEPEDCPDLSFMDEAELAKDHEVVCVALHTSGQRDYVGSVGNVVDADSNYLRVLVAELASELMPKALAVEDEAFESTLT